MNKHLQAIIHTIQGVLRSCLHSGHGTMVYQLTKHHHAYNAVVMHIACHH